MLAFDRIVIGLFLVLGLLVALPFLKKRLGVFTTADTTTNPNAGDGIIGSSPTLGDGSGYAYLTANAWLLPPPLSMMPTQSATPVQPAGTSSAMDNSNSCNGGC